MLLTLILLQQLGNFFLALVAFILLAGALFWLLTKYSAAVSWSTPELLSLKPEPMDLKGLAEVMAKPVLTAAWYAWATDPANGVRKPAAYLRSMVRLGATPTPQGDADIELFASPVEEFARLEVKEMIGGYFRSVATTFAGGRTL